MLLSVIIPFYGVEAYIGACLERVARLPQEDCEVLLVDDCGTDRSGEIAAAYCETHANARIIRREQNGGLSAARNTGLAQARGEYVYFLDSDDLPEPEAIYTLAQRAKADGLDVAKAHFRYYDDATGALTDGTQMDCRAYPNGQALFAAQSRSNTYEPMVWLCVFRLAMLRDIGLIMEEGMLFEDELFQVEALARCGRCAVFADVILLYRRRPGSIMSSYMRGTKWHSSYLHLCATLDALADTMTEGEAGRELHRRVGLIALGAVKNFTVCEKNMSSEMVRLTRAFLRESRDRFAGFAMRSGDSGVEVQGRLLRFSLQGYILCYRGLLFLKKCRRLLKR